MTTKLSRLGIVVTADSSDAQRNLQSTLSSIQSFTGITAAMGATRFVYEGIAKSIDLVSQAFQKVGQGIQHFGAVAERLGAMEDLAAKLEVSPETWQSWSRGAKIAGSSMEDLEKSAFGLRKSLGEALSGKHNPFEALHLSASKLASMDLGGQMGAVFDALNKISDPSQRLAIGEDVFGKGFRAIELMSKQGSAGLKAWDEEAKRLGITLDKGLLSRIGQADDRVNDLKLQWSAASDKITGAFAPALEHSAKQLSHVLSDLSKSHGPLDVFVSRLEATTHFTGLYLQELKNSSLGLAGASTGGIGRVPGIGGLAGGVLGASNPILGSMFGAVNTLGAETERKNDYERQLGELDAARQTREKQERAGQEFQKGVVSNIFNGIGKQLDHFGSKALGAAKQLDSLDKYATEFVLRNERTFNAYNGNSAPGALEVGSAAAYAATNQQQQIVQEQKKTNNLLKDLNTGIKKLIDLTPEGVWIT